VNRGGCWNNDADNCNATNRNNNDPSNRNNNLGFRLALVQAQGWLDGIIEPDCVTRFRSEHGTNANS